jgi:hypothetical protein
MFEVCISTTIKINNNKQSSYFFLLSFAFSSLQATHLLPNMSESASTNESLPHDRLQFFVTHTLEGVRFRALMLCPDVEEERQASSNYFQLHGRT